MVFETNTRKLLEGQVRIDNYEAAPEELKTAVKELRDKYKSGEWSRPNIELWDKLGGAEYLMEEGNYGLALAEVKQAHGFQNNFENFQKNILPESIRELFFQVKKLHENKEIEWAEEAYKEALERVKFDPNHKLTYEMLRDIIDSYNELKHEERQEEEFGRVSFSESDLIGGMTLSDKTTGEVGYVELEDKQ